MSDLAAALMVAIRVHAKQVDKQGEPYLLHVHRVVEGVNRSAQVVAALHDVIEDGGDEGLKLALGLDLDQPEGCALRFLTRSKHESYADYIACIAECPDVAGSLAREVKLADLHDNLGRIPPEPPWRKDGRGPDNAPSYHEWVKWRNAWGALRLRYEKAIETLEASS
jgi:hypothetical protein